MLMNTLAATVFMFFLLFNTTNSNNTRASRKEEHSLSNGSVPERAKHRRRECTRALLKAVTGKIKTEAAGGHGRYHAHSHGFYGALISGSCGNTWHTAGR